MKFYFLVPNLAFSCSEQDVFWSSLLWCHPPTLFSVFIFYPVSTFWCVQNPLLCCILFFGQFWISKLQFGITFCLSCGFAPILLQLLFDVGFVSVWVCQCFFLCSALFLMCSYSFLCQLSDVFKPFPLLYPLFGLFWISKLQFGTSFISVMVLHGFCCSSCLILVLSQFGFVNGFLLVVVWHQFRLSCCLYGTILPLL